MNEGDHPAAPLPGLDAAEPIAVIVSRDGVLPPGAQESVTEAGGQTLVVGSGAAAAAAQLGSPARRWWAETGPGLRPGALAGVLAQTLAEVPLIVLPASADGRDLAPRLAAAGHRPLLACAVRVQLRGGMLRAELARLDSRLLVEVDCPAPAVATLLPGATVPAVTGGRPPLAARLPPPPDVADPQLLELMEPDPETMDLAAAPRIIAGGGGLVPRGGSDAPGTAVFRLLAAVAGRLGASPGATRVASDAGWVSHDRQIGTTGVSVAPELYVALGISGASQHIGGLGAPRHVVSVNLDATCPMTAMADLGLVADARRVLVELARHLGVTVPAEVFGG